MKTHSSDKSLHSVVSDLAEALDRIMSELLLEAEPGSRLPPSYLHAETVLRRCSCELSSRRKPKRGHVRVSEADLPDVDRALASVVDAHDRVTRFSCSTTAGIAATFAFEKSINDLKKVLRNRSQQ
jgi:hypothetical protein